MTEQAKSADRLILPIVASRTWTPDTLAVVLGTVTPYPVRRGTQPDGADLVKSLGGRQRVRQLLAECLPLLSEPSRLILEGFLRGYARQQVVAYVIGRCPLHNSWVYRRITALPTALLPYFVARLDLLGAAPSVPSLPALLHTLSLCRQALRASDVEQVNNLAYLEQLVIQTYR